MLAAHHLPFSKNASFVRLDDARVLLQVHGASTYSEDGGLTWSPPRVMQDTNGDDLGGNNVSLVKLSNRNEIGLTGCRPPASTEASWFTYPPRSNKADFAALFWRSTDGGQTWQPPIQVSPPGFSCHGMNDTFVRTQSGRIVVPFYGAIGQRSLPIDRLTVTSGKLVRNQYVPTNAHFFDPVFTFVLVCYSDDDGRTWHRNDDGDLFILREPGATINRVAEASVTQVAPKRLMMIMRTALGRMYQAWSDDDGDTWTRPQPTSLAGTESPGQIRTLPNGHLLCIWNQESEDEVKRGQVRTRLSSAVSRDGGRVWEFFQNIESLHETTRVEPGPIHPVRPVELYPHAAGLGALRRDGEFVDHADTHGRWMYPAALVMDDRVIIAYGNAGVVTDDPVHARPRTEAPGGYVDEATQKVMCLTIKVLPLEWFYGGKQPADNPMLKRAYEPARP